MLLKEALNGLWNGMLLLKSARDVLETGILFDFQKSSDIHVIMTGAIRQETVAGFLLHRLCGDKFNTAEEAAGMTPARG